MSVPNRRGASEASTSSSSSSHPWRPPSFSSHTPVISPPALVSSSDHCGSSSCPPQPPKFAARQRQRSARTPGGTHRPLRIVTEARLDEPLPMEHADEKLQHLGSTGTKLKPRPHTEGTPHGCGGGSSRRRRVGPGQRHTWEIPQTERRAWPRSHATMEDPTFWDSGLTSPRTRPQERHRG